MAIAYCFQLSVDNINRDKSRRFVVKSLSKRLVSTVEMAQFIERSSSFTKGDVIGLISNIADFMATALLSGESLSLDGIGIFTSSAHLAHPVEDIKVVRAESVRFRKVVFRSSSDLRGRLQDAVYEYNPDFGSPKRRG